MGKGTRVGMTFPQGSEFVVAMLAITRIGAVAVPLSTFFRGPELLAAVRHADIHLLLAPRILLGHDTTVLFESVWPELADASEPELFLTEAPYLRRVWICGGGGVDRPWATTMPELSTLGDTEEVRDDLLARIESEVAPSDPMVMVFTSGATAAPKAVVHNHAAQVRQSGMLAELYGFTEDVRTFTTMPFFWVGGLTVVLLTHLHVGGTVITVERVDGVEMLDLIERTNPTRLVGWTLLERITGDPALADRDLTWLSELQPLSVRHPGRWHNSLGMTETSGPHTAAPAPVGDEELPVELRGSFGPSVPGFQHRIVDPDTGVTLPDGVEGEICVRGDSLMDGLYKRERRDVFDEDGWYHTGDRGFFRDGLLFFTGRSSGMIKTRGANVSPREVELAIEWLPGVQAAFVVGVPDDARGEIVCCMVCPEPGHDLDPDALTEQLRGQLSSYKVPGRILVVPYDEAPWLPSGKVSIPRIIERFLGH